MLEHLEADDAIEAIGGTGRVAGDKRVVTLGVRETRGAKRFREDAIASAVIKNPRRPDGGKQAAQPGGVGAGPRLLVVRIDQKVVVVVDETLEILDV